VRRLARCVAVGLRMGHDPRPAVRGRDAVRQPDRPALDTAVDSKHHLAIGWRVIDRVPENHETGAELTDGKMRPSMVNSICTSAE
jgi:hypothetical protein